MPNAQTVIVGNLGSDPELRFTNSGQAVVNFSVGVSERYYDTGAGEWRDRDTNWYRVNAWRQLAENIAESLHSGDRVIVVGDMRQRSYEKDDETRYVWELEARSIGCELSWAIARTKKVEREKPKEEKQPAKSTSRRKPAARKPAEKPADADPWEDEPPF